MELTQLRYFQAAASYEHISRAAEALNISQPALSTMISRLEKELGVSLFDHNGRSVVLNENGHRFLKRVNRILSEVDSSKRELQEMANIADTTISLAVSSSQFLQGMHTFTEEHKDYKWDLRAADTKEIVSMLNLGQIDFAVTSPGIYDPDYRSILLAKDAFRLAVHKDNPLSQRKSVRLRDIQNERFIMLLKGLPFRVQTDQIFSDLGFSPMHSMECDHLLRRELINSNAGVTIASESALFRHLYSEDIRFLDIKDVPHTREIVLTYPKNRYLSKAAKEFIKFLELKFSQNYFS